MKEFNKEEYNKLCAEFLNLESKPLAKGLYQIQYKHSISRHGFSEWTNEEMLLFDSDWNWIMEVVEKIENLKDEQGYRCRVDIYLEYSHIGFVNHVYPKLITGQSKKEAVVQAIWEFLLEYNKTKQL